MNKTTREVREMAQKMVQDPTYLEALKSRIQVGEAPHMEALLWCYAYGKPKEPREDDLSKQLDGWAEKLEKARVRLAEEDRRKERVVDVVAAETSGLATLNV